MRRRKSGFYRSIPLVSQISHHQYSLKKLPGEIAKEQWGECDSVKKTIALWEGMTTSELAEYWLHEHLHAIWNQFCIPKKGEEEIIEPLAKALVQFFQTNPDALDWWTRVVRASKPK